MKAEAEVRITIGSQVDVERARRHVRTLARQVGLDREAVEAVVLAVSELATNLVRYTSGGYIGARPLGRRGSVGIEVDSHDEGPGIDEPEAALREEFSTGAGLGAGLAGVRRLMDEFELVTGSAGTTVVCRKWRHPA